MALATLDTFDDVITFARDHVLRDASFDPDYLTQLATLADIQIAMEFAWSFLLAEDATKTRSSTDTYLTSYAIPVAPTYLYTKYINVGEQENVYRGVPFEQRYLYINDAQRFWIDQANALLYLSGTENTSKTIHHFYIKAPTVAATGNVTPSWPQQFRAITAYMMADILAGGDSDWDQIMPRKAAVFSQQTTKILSAMRKFDAARSRIATGGSYMGRRYNNQGYADRIYDSPNAYLG